MSDKVVGKIFVTSWKNYKKFRDNENNRDLDEKHVGRLVSSFKKNGWDIEPITVNKDYIVISGHHRLEAARRAEVDIKYTVSGNFACRACVGTSITIFIAPSNPRVLYNPTEDSRQVIVTFRVTANVLLVVAAVACGIIYGGVL